MLTSLALIFLVGLAMASICQKIKLPRIIGMLLTGIVLGPYVLDALDSSILSISAELREIALIIILIKAGLSLNLADLKKVGRPAILMSFVPALFEILAFVLFAPMLLGMSLIESLLMGAILGAVSPAVVVPKMVHLMDIKQGTKKSIPQLILAGASLDDVFVIVLFSTFLSLAGGEAVSMMSLFNIPISIVLGIFVGVVFGFILSWYFELKFSRQHYIRNSTKVIIVLAVSFLLISLENALEGVVSMSGLLAVMSMAIVIQMKSIPIVIVRLKDKFGKLWIAAEVILFVLVGAVVDIRYTLDAGLVAIAMIFIALAFRSVGVWISLLGTNLNFKERMFCIIAYLPKATVQAAIGSVPLAAGLPCGNLVLSISVLSILLTAPLGAIGIDCSYRKLLTKDEL